MTDNQITLDLTSDPTASALVATIKASVNGDAKYTRYVSVHGVTAENVADHARALAVATYPNDEPVQKKDGKRTRFGNAVQKAGAGLRRAITPEDSEDSEPTVQALLTKAGFAATMEQVIEAWKSAQV